MNTIFEKMKILGKGMDSNTLQCDYFYIGREGFVFENLYIPLEAISIVKLLRIADKPLKPHLIMAGIGLLLFISGIAAKSILFVLVGIAVLVYGCICIYITWKENKEKVYRILLKLNNGESYTLVYGTLEFTVRVVNKIRGCIAEKSDAKNYFVNKGAILTVNDNSIGKVCDNIFNGNIEKILAGINNSTT